MQLKPVAIKTCTRYFVIMSKREKQLQRFFSKPADFTWSELRGLLEGLWEWVAGQVAHESNSCILSVHR
jgi:hypothetical protein